MIKKIKENVENAIGHWLSGRALTVIAANIVTAITLGVQPVVGQLTSEQLTKLEVWVAGLVASVIGLVMSWGQRKPGSK